jgi:hypothetical protein
MSKKDKWKDDAIQWTPEGEFDRELTALSRTSEGRPEFVAPGAEQKWRARDLLDIHWGLVGIETPAKSFNRIMSCIIGHANPNTGRCQLKQKLIAAETNYSVKTVKRVTDWWVAKGFLKVQPTGLARSLAYHPQWDLFEMHWIAIAEDINAQKESWERHGDTPMDIKGGIAMDIKGGIDDGHHAVQHESQIGTSKKESQPERAHPPSASDAHVISSSEGKKEEALQGEQEAKPSTLPEGLSYGQAQEVVSRYCTGHHWQHLTQPDLDAAITAEIAEPGSGRAIVDAAADKNAKEAVNG